MKKALIILLSAVAVACSGQMIPSDQSTIDFNQNWRFIICSGSANFDTPKSVFTEEGEPEVPYGCALPRLKDGPSVLEMSQGPVDSERLASTKCDDSKWRVLDLPHDWAVEGDFNRDNPSGTGGGALQGGIGWYRKTFRVPQELEGKIISIEFDGVYMNSTVWINGQEVGTRPYGYISFSYDLTPYIKFGGSNVVAVRVDNSDQPNSRWYSGCGIYRNVRLRITEQTRISQWGIFARSTDGKKLDVTVTLDSQENADSSIVITNALIDKEGNTVATAESRTEGELTAEQSINLDNPHLWSISDPYLYDLKTTVTASGKTLDERHTPVGIRTVNFDPDKGFFLNGQHVKINGVCLHHDLGALGSAVNKSALRRQLNTMKEMGVNAVRCSHNPPSLELLDLCDEMGLVVMDEAFDMWRQRKTERDYARFFDKWHVRDLTDLVTRDRNHPSIIMWSIGNEVLEQWSSASADTLSLEEANTLLNFGFDDKEIEDRKGMSVNSLLTEELAAVVRSLDPTRPVTAGCNNVKTDNHLFLSGALDIIGFNYHNSKFSEVPEKFPGKPFIVSESVSSLMTRGYYHMPSDSLRKMSNLWKNPHQEPSFACSSYDFDRVPWGNTNEETLSIVEHNDFIGGQFIWTGFDYIGEPTPYGWPARSSYFGLVDLAGFPKDVYYLYQSAWRKDLDVLHVFPHWNWEEGQTVDIWTYYNNADCVELFVNGQSAGVRRKLSYEEVESGKKAEGDSLSMSSEYHCCWRVPFYPGEIKVVAYKDGKAVREKTVATASEPASLRLGVDKTSLTADGSEMVFVTVEVVDDNGNLCPWADNDIEFQVLGPGEIAGVDNGSPISLERFKANHRKAFYGKCLVIVRNTGKQGNITIRAIARKGNLRGSYTIPVK